MSLIVISFDGVKDTEFEKMAADAQSYPNIAAFMQSARYTGDVFTTFVSNTYPIHSCISTGRHPKEHGIVSNILGYADGAEIWAQEAKFITARTIFQAAAQKGLKIGTVAWPVTCGEKGIKWNLPEVHLLPGQNRIIEHMRHGSAIFQIRALLRHGKKMQGLKQPYLDDFFTSVMVDLLREKKPDLAMVHLLAYDDFCHNFGICDETDTARAALDHNLGRILAAAGDDATVIVFSDHGHLNVSENIDLAPIFGDILHEQCGGSAFFTRKVEIIEEYSWFGRLLTEEEMDVSGYAGRAAFGIGAARGFSFSDLPHRANHGYPRDYDEYRVFFAVKNAKRAPHRLPFEDIRNVTAIIDQELGLGMDL
ncbi:MAG: alkaline phosphatase family protein [Clostridiales bacterium]|jgi:predicted AlkP superfamily pyrophosphatase or phosphodiesterase|nr:alkaline phosphatase family protein [Clostridiales bacterium]